MLIKEDVRMPVVEVTAGQQSLYKSWCRAGKNQESVCKWTPCFVLKLFTALYSPSPQLYALS